MAEDGKHAKDEYRKKALPEVHCYLLLPHCSSPLLLTETRLTQSGLILQQAAQSKNMVTNPKQLEIDIFGVICNSQWIADGAKWTSALPTGNNNFNFLFGRLARGFSATH
jgi:hypothetical protein